MMSVEEYAQDTNSTVSNVLEICKKFNIKATTKDDMLSEDDIIVLDNEISVNDESLEQDDTYIDDDELESDLRIDTSALDTNETKMKKKQVIVKKEDNNKYLKAKKDAYKHKEKLKSNASNIDSSVVLYTDQMTVSDLAHALNVQASVVLKKLFDLGVMANINQSLDFTTAEMVTIDFGKELKNKETQDISNFENYEIIDKEEDLTERPPVVTIMGHVDHGKTSLLDVIRESNIVLKEAGGITQAIGAYQVKAKEKLITFIDTPGHEAFTAMRARGASVTDIVIIIVSAVDGIKPQTIEAIDHAKAANVPIIVAINKMDLPSANPDRVLQELVEYGLTPEEWGGDTLVNKISCKTKEGIDELLDNIILIADMCNFRANPNRYATGTVLEARLDKHIGAVATLIVQNGTLRLGDPIVVGNSSGKVRTLKNDLGIDIVKALPSTPVEVTGFSDLPTAGDKFMAFETEKEAKKVANERELRSKHENTNRTGMTLEDLFGEVKEGNTKRINVILKTDVKGSEEAIKASLLKLDVDGIKIDVIRSGVGTIVESDIVLAQASRAIIIGFNVRPTSNIIENAKERNVDIRLYNVIYKILEDLEAALKGMLDPEFEEKILASATVRQLFKFSKVGTIAGVIVNEGAIKLGSTARVIRDGIIVYEGKIGSIQRGKDKVNEVKKGIECGITIENFNDIKEEDVIETYTMEEIKK